MTSTRRFQVVGQPELVGYDEKGNPRIRVCFRWNGGKRQQKTVTVSRLTQPGDGNAKLRKGKEAYTVGLSLAPVGSGGIGNTCPHASTGCSSACLDETGMGFVFLSIHVARVAKTAVFYRDRVWFIRQLTKEIAAAERKAEKLSKPLAVRLNVFSDVQWEKIAPELFSAFPAAAFYDYTKHPRRAGQLLPNYWVTFSRSETNHDDALQILASGGNVAVVWDTGKTSKGHASGDFVLPATWNGFPVIDGDETDLRYDDPKGGYVVGLKLKSASAVQRLQAVSSGFAIA